MLESLSYKTEDKVNLVLMDRLYSQRGLWIQSHGCQLKVGLTDKLARELGEVSSVSLPSIGGNARQGTKTVKVSTHGEIREFESPLSGRVREVNPKLDQQPELLVQDPFGEGWLFEVDPFDWESDKDALLSPLEFYELQTEDEA
ncbi:MAG: glycine cleavage system protein H [Anaerolineaceae bacterium]